MYDVFAIIRTRTAMACIMILLKEEKCILKYAKKEDLLKTEYCTSVVTLRAHSPKTISAGSKKVEGKTLCCPRGPGLGPVLRPKFFPP